MEKCADYLPPSEVLDCHRVFGDYQITLKRREVREKYVVSNLQIKNLETNLWRELTHVWYTSWPATGEFSGRVGVQFFILVILSINIGVIGYYTYVNIILPYLYYHIGMVI